MGSFFQYTNRTVTNEGRALLSKVLTENKTEGIVDKQNTIKELSKKVRWRQHFSALASLVTTKDTTDFIVGWIQNYKPVLPKFIKTIQIIFFTLSLVLI